MYHLWLQRVEVLGVSRYHKHKHQIHQWAHFSALSVLKLIIKVKLDEHEASDTNSQQLCVITCILCIMMTACRCCSSSILLHCLKNIWCFKSIKVMIEPKPEGNWDVLFCPYLPALTYGLCNNSVSQRKLPSAAVLLLLVH